MTRALRHASVLALAACAGCFTPPANLPAADGGGVQACAAACGEAEVCVDGACLPRTCERVTCLAGSRCVTGHCYPDSCGAGPCGPGRVCDGRVCVELACAGVSCAFGTCVDGGCPACSALEFYDPATARCQVKKSPGAGCGTGAECASGFCADGVCCDRPCDAACEQCAAGRCAFRAALDPGGPPNCFPGRCSGRSRACSVTCSADTDCADGGWCNAGLSCKQALAQGDTCTRDAMCASGHCAGGTCCEVACSGNCQSCAAAVVGDAGYPGGVCHPVAANNFYYGCGLFLCSPTQLGCPNVCGKDSDCTAGSFCGADAGCQKLILQGSSCGRDGECLTFNCRDGTCCASGCVGACTLCKPGGTCTNLADGLTDAGCPNGGVCAQGVCCNQNCQGACERCDVKGAIGTCTGVSGADFACQTYGTCRGDAGCGLTCSKPMDCSSAGVCTAGTCQEPCTTAACVTTFGKGYCCGADNRCHTNQVCVDF